MSSSRFPSPEAAVAYMKTVAVGRSGFSRWLDVEPLKVWEGESELLLQLRPEMTQHHGYAHGAIVGLMADKRQVVVRADVWAESDDAAPVHVAVAQATIVPTGIVP
jgi:hypothetical protein